MEVLPMEVLVKFSLYKEGMNDCWQKIGSCLQLLIVKGVDTSTLKVLRMCFAMSLSYVVLFGFVNPFHKLLSFKLVLLLFFGFPNLMC